MVHGCKVFQDLLKAHVFLEHVLQTRACYGLDSLKLLNFIDWFVGFQVHLLLKKRRKEKKKKKPVDKHGQESHFNLNLMNQ